MDARTLDGGTHPERGRRPRRGTGVLAAAACLALAVSAQGAVSLLDDVSSTTVNNYGASRTAPGGSGTIQVNFVGLTNTPKPRGNRDYSLEIIYNVSGAGVYVYSHDRLTNSGTVDLSAYKYLSFWVRGAVGGESFMVGLGNSSPWFESKVQVNDWLPGGITTQWQKVVIPISVLDGYNPDFNPATVDKVVFLMQNGFQMGANSGTVYIDDVTFGSATPDIWLDNFNDGKNPNACQVNNETWPPYTMTYVPVTYTPNAPYVERLDYVAGTGSTFVHRLPSNNGSGVDLSQNSHLEFDVRGLPAGGQCSAVRIHTYPGDNYTVSMCAYVTVSDSVYRHVSIPLADFTSLANLTQSSEVDFDESGGYTSAIFVDNLVIRNLNAPLVPAAPTGMTYNGNSVHTGYAIYENASVSVTASSLGADAKMEGVKFEYSGDGGATWTTIGDDYATSAGKTTYGRFWDVSAVPFQDGLLLRATAFHADGSTSPALQYSVNHTNGTPTFTPTLTPSPTPTLTPSPTLTRTQTPTATTTSTITLTSTVSPTGTITPVFSSTATPTISATYTATRTATPTATPSASPSPIVSFTATPTVTPTITASPTPLPTLLEVYVGRNSFNPANGETLPVQVVLRSRGALRITIYGRNGAKIKALHDREAGPGPVPVVWDGKNDQGETAASGIYVIFVDAPDLQAKRLVAVIK